MADKKTIEQEIQEALDNDVVYDFERMFPKREGFGAKRQVRAKLKLIKNAFPSLKTALLEEEKLLYVARGVVVNWFEQLFAGGMVAYYANLTTVVVTDFRILLLHVDGKGRPKHYRNQLLYTEVEKVKMGGFLSNAAKFKFKDGTALTMGGFKGDDRKHMKTIIPELVASMPEDAPRVEKSIQYVCPYCPAIYTELVSECPDCGTAFKSAKKAALMSLFVPGLGDMYLGHTAFGMLEMVWSLIEWLVLIAAVSGVISGEEGSVEFLFFWLMIMGGTNLIDFALTRQMGRKGLIPKSKKRPQKAQTVASVS